MDKCPIKPTNGLDSLPTQQHDLKFAFTYINPSLYNVKDVIRSIL